MGVDAVERLAVRLDPRRRPAGLRERSTAPSKASGALVRLARVVVPRHMRVVEGKRQDVESYTYERQGAPGLRSRAREALKRVPTEANVSADEVPDWEGLSSNQPPTGPPGSVVLHDTAGGEAFFQRVANVYDDQGRLASTAQADIAKVARDQLKPGEVKALYVATRPDARRKGYATKLYDALRESGLDIVPAIGQRGVSAEGSSFTRGYLKGLAGTRPSEEERRVVADFMTSKHSREVAERLRGVVEPQTYAAPYEGQWAVFHGDKPSVTGIDEARAREHVKWDVNARPDLAAVDRRIRAMDEVLQRHALPEDVEVHRGTTAKHFAGMKPGDTFTDKSFASTSVEPDVARQWAFFTSLSDAGLEGPEEWEWAKENRPDLLPPIPTPVVMHIKVPAGTHALDVGAFSAEFGKDVREQEMLLERGLEYRITKRGRIVKDDKGEYEIIEAEVVSKSSPLSLLTAKLTHVVVPPYLRVEDGKVIQVAGYEYDRAGPGPMSSLRTATVTGPAPTSLLAKADIQDQRKHGKQPIHLDADKFEAAAIAVGIDIGKVKSLKVRFRDLSQHQGVTQNLGDGNFRVVVGIKPKDKYEDRHLYVVNNSLVHELRHVTQMQKGNTTEYLASKEDFAAANLQHAKQGGYVKMEAEAQIVRSPRMARRAREETARPSRQGPAPPG